jgi:hypothetical protein
MSTLIHHLERGAVLGPRLAAIVDLCRGDIGVAEPLIGSIPDLRNQLRPAVEDRHDLAFFGRRQADGHAGNAEIVIALQYIDIFGCAAQRHRQALRIAACFLGHWRRRGMNSSGLPEPAAGACGINPSP